MFNSFLSDFIIWFANNAISGSIGVPNRIPPNWTTLDNWAFEDFILANEPFAKALIFFWNSYIS